MIKVWRKMKSNMEAKEVVVEQQIAYPCVVHTSTVLAVVVTHNLYADQ
jgi:hypothetical protein